MHSRTRRAFFRTAAGSGLLGVAGCTGSRAPSDGAGDGSGTGAPSDGTGQDDGSGTVTWSVTGSSEGSPANAWVQGFAAVLENHTERYRWSPELQAGWREALVRLSRGETDAGISWYPWLYNAQHERDFFAEDGRIGPLEPTLVGMLPVVHQGFWFLATYADNEVETPADLDGKVVGLSDTRVSLESLWAQRIIGLAGAEPRQYQAMNFSETGNALRSESVDAALVLAINGSILPGPHARAFTSAEISAVRVSEAMAEEAKAANGLFSFGEVRGDDLTEEAHFERTYAFLNVSGIHTRAGMDPDVVYDMTRAIVEHQADLEQYHPALGAFGVGDGRHNFEGVPDGTKFHEGALRYYDEVGVEIPKQPDRLP